jgi:hypothetical protein
VRALSADTLRSGGAGGVDFIYFLTLFKVKFQK